jgi:hypothetical protein
MKIIVRRMILLLCFAAWTNVLQAVAVPLPKRNDYPPAMSFLVLDLKYDTNRLKVCEFGIGALSGFVGHQKLYGPDKIWNAWWAFVASHDRPVFLVNTQGCASFSSLYKNSKKKHPGLFAKNTLFACKGMAVSSWKDVLRVLPAAKAPSLDMNAIAVTFNSKTVLPEYATFANNKHGVALVDYVSAPFGLNKLYMHALFANDQAVERFRPKCGVFDKGEIVDAVDYIKQVMPADAYVIKPINAWKGMGINMTSADDLQKKCTQLFSKETCKNHVFWQHRNEVLIESLEHSMPVQVADQLYDATMRVALGISYARGAVRMKILGAYWKLPTASLEEEASLQKTFISHIVPGAKVVTSAMVDYKTLVGVEKDLRLFIPHVYKKMVALKHSNISLKELKTVVNGTVSKELIKRLALL